MRRKSYFHLTPRLDYVPCTACVCACMRVYVFLFQKTQWWLTFPLDKVLATYYSNVKVNWKEMISVSTKLNIQWWLVWHLTVSANIYMLRKDRQKRSSPNLMPAFSDHRWENCGLCNFQRTELIFNAQFFLSDSSLERVRMFNLALFTPYGSNAHNPKVTGCTFIQVRIQLASLTSPAEVSVCPFPASFILLCLFRSSVCGYKDV